MRKSGAYTLFWFPFEAELICACRGVGFLFRSYAFFCSFWSCMRGRKKRLRLHQTKVARKNYLLFVLFSCRRVGDA